MPFTEFDKLIIMLEKRYDHEPYHRGRQSNQRIGGDSRVMFGGSRGYTRKTNNIIGDIHKKTGSIEEIAIDKLRDAPGFKPVDAKMFAHLRSEYGIDANKLDENGKQLGRSGKKGYSVFVKKEMINNKPTFTLYSKRVVLPE